MPPVTPRVWRLAQTTAAFRLTMNGRGETHDVLHAQLLGGPMRLVRATTRPSTMRPGPSGADGPVTHEAFAWLRSELAWERRLAQLRAHAELAPLGTARDPAPDTGVRQ